MEIETGSDSDLQGHARHRPGDVFRSEHRPAGHDVSGVHPIGAALVLDLYAASIAAATGNLNIPKAGFDKLLVYVPLRQRIQVKESREFERVAGIKAVRIFPEELAAREPTNWCCRSGPP